MIGSPITTTPRVTTSHVPPATGFPVRLKTVAHTLLQHTKRARTATVSRVSFRLRQAVRELKMRDADADACYSWNRNRKHDIEHEVDQSVDQCISGSVAQLDPVDQASRVIHRVCRLKYGYVLVLSCAVQYSVLQRTYFALLSILDNSRDQPAILVLVRSDARCPCPMPDARCPVPDAPMSTPFLQRSLGNLPVPDAGDSRSALCILNSGIIGYCNQLLTAD